MNIKKILIYVIFAFVMITPFSVSAESNFLETGVLFDYVTASVPLTNAQISFVEEVLIQKTGSTDFNYFVTYNPDGSHYRVYVNPNGSPFYFIPYFENESGFDILLSYETYYNVNFNTSEFSGEYSSSSGSYGYYANFVSFLHNADGYYKNGEFYNLSYAEKKLNIDYLDINSFNNLEVVSPVLYANTEFISAVAPLDLSARILYKDLSQYASWSNLTLSYQDYPVFLNSNFPKFSGSLVNLTPAVGSNYYDEDVTLTYSYDGLNNNNLEVTVLIGDQPYKCKSGLFDKCVSREDYDYFDFSILVDGTITSKVYFSKDGINFTKTVTNFSKVDGGYRYLVDSLGAYENGYKAVKFVINLTDEQNAIFTIKYNSKHLTVDMPVSTYDDSLYTEFDMTGLYAVGLIPKTNKLNSSIKLLGNFVTYYSFNNDSYAYKYDTISTLNYLSRTIDFTPFINQKYQIFYAINKNSSNSESIAKIKYLSSYFDIITFSSYSEVVSYNDYNYVAPDINVAIKGTYDGNVPGSIDSSKYKFEFNDLFASLPDFIVSLAGAFTALGTCIIIAFGSLPDLVQSVMWFILIATALAICIKVFLGR